MNKKIILAIATMLISGAVSFANVATQPGMRTSPGDNLDKQLQEILDKYRTEYGVPGLSMSVSLGSDTATRNYVSGTTQLNGTQKVDANTIFQIGSNTKAFTAAIILQLEAEGKLSIQDTLGKYLPNKYPEWNNVSLLQLMNMSSGIPNYTNLVFTLGELKNPYKSWILEDLANHTYNRYKDINNDTSHPGLRFTPGTKWRYTNTAYILLGMIIEKVTGNSYTNELEARLIGTNAPLGIQNTYYIMDSPLNYPAYIQNDMSYAYVQNSHLNNDEIQDVTAVNVSGVGPAGGIVSTLKDNIIWDRALFGGKVLPEQQQQELENECMIDDSSRGESYCLGVEYVKDYAVSKDYILKGKTWEYNGSIYGQNFAYELLPDNTVIVIAANAIYDDNPLEVCLGSDLVNAVIITIENYKGTHKAN